MLAGAASPPATTLGARRIKLTWPLTLAVWRAPCIHFSSPAVCIVCSCRSSASSLLSLDAGAGATSDRTVALIVNGGQDFPHSKPKLCVRPSGVVSSGFRVRPPRRGVINLRDAAKAPSRRHSLLRSQERRHPTDTRTSATMASEMQKGTFAVKVGLAQVRTRTFPSRRPAPGMRRKPFIPAIRRFSATDAGVIARRSERRKTPRRALAGPRREDANRGISLRDL